MQMTALSIPFANYYNEEIVCLGQHPSLRTKMNNLQLKTEPRRILLVSRKLAYRIRVKPFFNGATLSVKDPFSKLDLQVISEVRKMSLHNSMQP